MVINRDNYEEYIVDFSEGNLSPELMAEMETLLKANSDIQDELEMFLEAPIIDKSITYNAKDSLKQIPFEKTDASSKYFQTQCVAYLEGLMPENEVDFFIDLVEKDEEKRKELQLFRKTLLPVEDFHFNEKILLKVDELNHIVSNNNFEEYCIACNEGWLNQSGLVALNKFIANNPEKKKDLDFFSSLKLTPDYSIVYPDKRKIKKFSILSLQTKKIFSYAASAAAVLVFGVMAFYTTKLENPTSLASKVNDSKPAQIVSVETAQNTENRKGQSLESKGKKLLHDPFGFEKVSSPLKVQEAQLIETERLFINPISPIQISQLDCKPCKDIFENDPQLTAIEQEYQKINTTSIENNAANNNIVWNVAQAGISGINKISNAKIKVEQESQKTKIQFKSKYFAFSTNIKRK